MYTCYLCAPGVETGTGCWIKGWGGSVTRLSKLTPWFIELATDIPPRVRLYILPARSCHCPCLLDLDYTHPPPGWHAAPIHSLTMCLRSEQHDYLVAVAHHISCKGRECAETSINSSFSLLWKASPHLTAVTNAVARWVYYDLKLKWHPIFFTVIWWHSCCGWWVKNHEAMKLELYNSFKLHYINILRAR